MTRILSTLLFAVFFFVLTTGCRGQATIQLLDNSEILATDLDQFLQTQMQELELPGLSIAVINNKEVVYHRTFGVKSAQVGTPIDNNTLFEAASISKSIFAFYAMKMVEDGIIDLDTPLYTYLPNYDLDHDERYKKITARHLLTHQSGLPNWRYENKGQYLNLRFEPGTDFSYSGEGYEYLGNVLAHLNGSTRFGLQEFIHKEVFEPLNMEHALFIADDKLEENKANGHNMGVANGRYMPQLPSMAGGLQTEALSLARFMVGIMEGAVLKEETLSEMLSPQVELPEDHVFVTNYDTEAWALGFGVDRTDHGIIHSHGGNNGDFQSHMEFQKQKGFGYVFLTNSDRGERLNAKLKPFMRTGSEMLSELEEIYNVVDRRIELLEEPGFSGISLNAFPDDGFAWIKDQSFSEGTIEFDMRGSDEQGASFVGIAFHGEDDENYEGIYFRPFNFNAEDANGRSHMVQYHSIPEFTWRVLRDQSPGQYEAEIPSPPAPDDWFHTRIEVQDSIITVYVNDDPTPVLQVESLQTRQEGKIGLWVGYNTAADFANLNISN